MSADGRGKEIQIVSQAVPGQSTSASTWHFPKWAYPGFVPVFCAQYSPSRRPDGARTTRRRASRWPCPRMKSPRCIACHGPMPRWRKPCPHLTPMQSPSAKTVPAQLRSKSIFSWWQTSGRGWRGPKPFCKNSYGVAGVASGAANPCPYSNGPIPGFAARGAESGRHGNGGNRHEVGRYHRGQSAQGAQGAQGGCLARGGFCASDLASWPRMANFTNGFGASWCISAGRRSRSRAGCGSCIRMIPPPVSATRRSTPRSMRIPKGR